VVNDDVEEANKTHRTEIAELKAQEAQADAEFRELLRAEREEREAAIEKLAKDKELLAEWVSRSSSGRYGRRIARGCAWVGGGLMTVASAGTLAPADQRSSLSISRSIFRPQIIFADIAGVVTFLRSTVSRGKGDGFENFQFLPLGTST
jgi:hypothetical protein